MSSRLAEGITAIPLPLAPTPVGIYALCQNDGEGFIVVYVGQSVNIPTRIATHVQEGRKIFDSFAVLEHTDAERLDEREEFYIHLYHPQFNGTKCKHCDFGRCVAMSIGFERQCRNRSVDGEFCSQHGSLSKRIGRNRMLLAVNDSPETRAKCRHLIEQWRNLVQKELEAK